MTSAEPVAAGFAMLGRWLQLAAARFVLFERPRLAYRAASPSFIGMLNRILSCDGTSGVLAP